MLSPVEVASVTESISENFFAKVWQLCFVMLVILFEFYFSMNQLFSGNKIWDLAWKNGLIANICPKAWVTRLCHAMFFQVASLN